MCKTQLISKSEGWGVSIATIKMLNYFFSKVFYICLINVCFSHLFCGYFQSERFQRLQKLSALSQSSQRGFLLRTAIKQKCTLKLYSGESLVPTRGCSLCSSRPPKFSFFSYYPWLFCHRRCFRDVNLSSDLHSVPFLATLAEPEKVWCQQEVSVQLRALKSSQEPGRPEYLCPWLLSLPTVTEGIGTLMSITFSHSMSTTFSTGCFRGSCYCSCQYFLFCFIFRAFSFEKWSHVTQITIITSLYSHILSWLSNRLR